MRIYASTFNRPIMKYLENKVIPLEVGSDLRTDFLYELHDNTGDNISRENAYFGELTGLYWIWKNASIQDDEIVGFCHYGKGFLISCDKVESVIRGGYQWITTRRQCLPAYGKPNYLRTLHTILINFDIDVENAFSMIYAPDGSSSKCIAKNMFITTGKELNEYCNFLFPVLFELRRQIGDTDLKASSNRYCALLTERIFTAWLHAKKKKIYEVDIRSSKLSITLMKAVINRLPFSGNSNFLKFLRKKAYCGAYKH